MRSLLELGLLDELRIQICPTVVGTGKRLFDVTDAPTGLELIDSRTFPHGVVALTYRPGTIPDPT